MNREDIIRMAHEAGIRIAWQSDTIDPRNVYAHELLRFAALVAAAEREKLNNGRCIACGNHITEGGGQVVPTLEGSNGQA